ncbi:F-box domain-containing protein [Purpureocillium lilacinum]|uniref:F-box domain-containing protein n=1 Tax=Purpureocillium lilacinum TaxID=33203 RepID=A0A179H0G1_PURLI|nr:F-box domain-containing protein [Purpureocillium lilacinum]OAQ83736.1 F-box domain-containing protein [Purpureocillium lilacinum]OAQ90516.1 F-box domain-containing protein [Purpureocillium lilacinum]PWI68761.1 hypothetical protein PCL_01850 [Purpureocillium lilacinum]
MPELDDITYPTLQLDDHLLDEKLPSARPILTINPDQPPAHATLGALDILPLELLDHVLAQLDLCTVISFRHINRRAAQLVEFSPTYRAISRHASNALCAALNIGCAQWVTCGALYGALCTWKCESCGDFAGYIYLVACARVCFLCFTSRRQYLPLRPSHARRKFGLSGQIVNALPHVRALPGVYTPREKKLHRVVLVDYASARHAGIAHHGSEAAMNRYMEATRVAQVQAYNAKGTASGRSASSAACHTHPPKLEDPPDDGPWNPFRFAAVCRVPWLNSETQQVESGFHCLGCKYEIDLPLNFRREFTRASFGEHLEECGPIVDGKHCPGS